MEAAGFEPCICTGRSTVLLCHAHQFELSFRISYVLNYIRNLRNCKILRVFNDIVILTVAIPGKAYRTEFFLFPNSCILTLYSMWSQKPRPRLVKVNIISPNHRSLIHFQTQMLLQSCLLRILKLAEVLSSRQPSARQSLYFFSLLFSAPFFVFCITKSDNSPYLLIISPWRYIRLIVIC